eukprot:CAMPEP_0168354120 /NCGR_PEP_ID=MMETSP0213-20121227/23687_1 /TAXON_ID=151035 /ORGANISM="Euplotes harpa, Strain FSP1.4" /LENGTH=91 /DNA_ID=CAMNT_0008365921 /DNA_START=36 /DNA_END=311 /DNA_ORIENTATION=-
MPAVFLILDPAPFLACAVSLDIDAFTVPFAIFKLALIIIAAGVNGPALAVSLIVFVVALVDLSVLGDGDPDAVLLLGARLELAHVDPLVPA